MFTNQNPPSGKADDQKTSSNNPKDASASSPDNHATAFFETGHKTTRDIETNQKKLDLRREEEFRKRYFTRKIKLLKNYTQQYLSHLAGESNANEKKSLLELLKNTLENPNLSAEDQYKNYINLFNENNQAILKKRRNHLLSRLAAFRGPVTGNLYIEKICKITYEETLDFEFVRKLLTILRKNEQGNNYLCLKLDTLLAKAESISLYQNVEGFNDERSKELMQSNITRSMIELVGKKEFKRMYATVKQKLEQSDINNLCLEIMFSDDTSDIAIRNFLNTPNLDLNAKTAAGYPPIYYALMTGNFKVAENLIIEHHVHVLDTYDGLTLRDIAKKQSYLSELQGMDSCTTAYETIDKLLAERDVRFDPKKLSAFIKANEPSSFSTQAWIKTPMERLGYQKSEGYCYGVGMRGAEAILVSPRGDKNELVEFNKFKSRIKRIKELDWSSLEECITLSKLRKTLLIEKGKLKWKLIKRNQELLNAELLKYGLNNSNLSLSSLKQLWLENEVDTQLGKIGKIDCEILPFLETVQIHQNHNKYKIFKGVKAFELLSLNASSLWPASDGMIYADLFCGVYDEWNLNVFFTDIKRYAQLNNYKSPIVMSIIANNHLIVISYDPLCKRWSAIDANIEIVYPSEDGLAKLLKKLLFIPPTHEKLMLRFNILCAKSQAASLKQAVLDPLHETPNWNEMHTINSSKLKYSDNNNYDLAMTAFLHDDIHTLRKIREHNEVPDLKFKITAITLILTGVILLSTATVLTAGFGLPLILALAGGCLATGFLAVGSVKLANSLAVQKQDTLTNNNYDEKMAPFNQAVKDYNSKKPTSNVSQTLNNKEVANENNILQINYTHLSREDRHKFRSECLRLDDNDLIYTLLRFQNKQDVERLLQSWNNIKENSQTSTAQSQITRLNGILTLMQSYNLANSEMRAQYRKVFLELPVELQRLVLKNFQSESSLKRLQESLENLTIKDSTNAHFKVGLKSVIEAISELEKDSSFKIKPGLKK